MAEIVHIGSGLGGDNVHIFEDKRTYLIDNHLVPKNGYLVKIRFEVTQLGGPLKLYILRRNKRGKIKIRNTTTITPNSTGEQVFSVQTGSLKVMKITKRDFIGVYIPEGGSLLAFKDKNKDRIVWKRNKPDSDKNEKVIKKLALKMRAKVSLQKAAFEAVDYAKGNFEINFNNGKYEVGDFTKNSFKCVVKAQKFDENLWYQIEYKTNNISYVVTDHDEDDVIQKIEVKLEYGLEEIDKFVIYPHEETALNNDGAFEYEIHFAQKPSSNKIRFNIDFNGVIFYPQLPYNQQVLSQEDIDAGIDYRTETEGRAGGPTGILKVKNPIENVDSLVIYRSENKSFHKDEDSQESYASNKVGHIERIKITDALDNYVYGEQELKYNESQEQWKYIITIPQSFLDSATYPIIVDPTFGYTTLGGTSWVVENVIVGYVANPGEYGCCCDLFAGIAYWINGDPVKMALYRDSDSRLISPQSVERDDGHPTAQFEQFPIVPLVGGGIFIEDIDYIIAAWFGGDTDLRRDNLGVPGISKYVNVTYDGWPVNPTFISSTNAYSTYAFYNQVTPVSWGITSQVVNNTFSPTYVMYMGGISPDTPDMVARQIRVRVTLAAAGQLAVALYVGGTLDNPTGAIKVTENYAVPAIAGWNNIDINPVVFPNNSVIWIGVAINDGNEIYYSPNASDSGDFQSIRGNWRDNLPENHNTNTPLPINPQPGVFENNYLQVYLYYTVDPNIRGEINTTLQDVQFNSQAFLGYLAEMDNTLDEVLFDGEGTPIKEGEINATLDEVLCVGEGTPIKEGEINATLDEVLCVGEGEKINYAEINSTLDQVLFDATGQKTLSCFLNAVLEEITILMEGKIENKAEINSTLDQVLCVGEGTPIKEGEINTTLDQVLFDGEGLNFAPHIGTMNVILDQVLFDAIVNVKEKTKGTINVTLDQVLFDGSGEKKLLGEINSTLDQVLCVGEGTPIKEGEINATLDQVLFDGEGTPIKEGEINATLDEVQFDGVVLKIVEGHIHQILSAVQFNATAGRPATGSINTILDEVQVSNFNGVVISRPISMPLIKYGIKKAVECAFKGPVVWENYNFPQPTVKYISLQITNLDTISFDDPYKNLEGSPDTIEYIGNRFYQVRMTAHSDSEDDPIAILEDVRDYIRDSSSCKYVELAKSVYIEAISIVNLTSVDNIRDVGRAQMNVIFRTFAQYRRDVSHIEQVDFTGKFNIGDNKFKVVNTSIKE